METLLQYLWPVLWGIGLALLVTSPILLLIFLRFLAERNLFFTLVEEGSAKAIMRGEEFRRFVMAYQGFTFDEEWNVVELKKAPTSSSLLRQWFKKRLGGIRWLGWPFLDTVYEYNFRWTVLRESKASKYEDGFVDQRELPNKKCVVAFAKRIDYIYLRDAVYYDELIGTETEELMPVDIFMLLPIRIINAYKALFRVHKWLDTTQDLIKPMVRSWAAETSYQEVIKKREVAEREFDTFLASKSGREEGKSIGDYLLDTYGVRVKRITFEDIVPPEEYSKAATRRVEAEQKEKEIEVLAKAEATRVKTSFDPIIERGEAGLAIRALESLDKAGQSPGNWIITAGPGLAENLTKLASGVKVPEKGEMK